jgi:hypothetical protein
MEDDDQEPSEGESDDEEDQSTVKPSRSIRSQNMEEDSRVMLQQLKKASSADVDKGIHVRKQLVSSIALPTTNISLHGWPIQSFWDTLLEARIRLQKCMSSLNSLPAVSKQGQIS